MIRINPTGASAMLSQSTSASRSRSPAVSIRLASAGGTTTRHVERTGDGRGVRKALGGRVEESLVRRVAVHDHDRAEYAQQADGEIHAERGGGDAVADGETRSFVSVRWADERGDECEERYAENASEPHGRFMMRDSGQLVRWFNQLNSSSQATRSAKEDARSRAGNRAVRISRGTSSSRRGGPRDRSPSRRGS